MPAPAPCASTQQAQARVGFSSNPETLRSGPTEMLNRSADERTRTSLACELRSDASCRGPPAGGACPAAPVGDILGSIMLPEANDYDALRSRFAWRVPERYNIGIDVCDKWAAAEPDRLALIEVGEDGGRTRLTFGELSDQSNRLANLLAAHGIGPGDRIGVLLPQSPI